MSDFSSRKVPVFPGINDIPVQPTAELAGNGSDLINRYNNLVQDLESEFNQLAQASSKTLLPLDQNFYVNSASGNDDTGDGSQATPYASFNKLSKVLKQSIIANSVIIFVSGQFDEVIDLSGLTGQISDVVSAANKVTVELRITGNGSGTIKLSGTSYLRLDSRNIAKYVFKGSNNGDLNVTVAQTLIDADISFETINFRHVEFANELLRLENCNANFLGCACNLTKTGANPACGLVYANNSWIRAGNNNFYGSSKAVYYLENSRLTLTANEIGLNNTNALFVDSYSVAYLTGYTFASGSLSFVGYGAIHRGTTIVPKNSQILTFYVEIASEKLYTVCWSMPYSGYIKMFAVKCGFGNGDFDLLVNSNLTQRITQPGTAGKTVNFTSPNKTFQMGDTLQVGVNITSEELNDLAISIFIEAN